MRKVYFLAILIGLISCKKTLIEDVKGDSLRISILPLEELSLNAFKVTGSLEIRNLSGDIAYGLLVGKTLNPTEANSKSFPIASTSSSVDFTQKIEGLDTGQVYYVRAYAKRNNLIEYSANQTLAKVSPQILRADTSLNYGRTLSLFTNIVKIDPQAQVQVLLNNKPITLKSISQGFMTTTFLAEFDESFLPGTMELSLKVGSVTIKYPKSVKVLSGKWKQLNDLPFADTGFSLWTERIRVGDWIYALGLSQQSTPVFSKFNFLTGQQVTLSTIPEGYAYQNGAVVALGNEIHFIAGEKVGNYQNWLLSKAHFVYNINSGTWRRESDFPGDERSDPVAFVYGEKLYMGMGANRASSPVVRNDYFSDMWTYQPQSKTWSRLSSFPEEKGRLSSGTFTIGSKFYLTGGVSKTQYSNTPNKETWCYDIAADRWSKKASFPGKAQVFFASFTINGKGYVGLGESSSYNSYYGRNLETDFYRYDADKDDWTQVSSGPQPAGNPFSASYGEYGIYGAGADVNSTAKTSLFAFYP
ncbi:hypothetical protein [Pedobacter sp. BMA]|uniref:Kelch repeat-containing protein n=1 Tax=Pedobacter sp. BMA TaxID=1663685 RepID=UPI00064ABCFC|nr:hypothetical protein [Pedobacter sp. BMA]KLT66605.1 hypothetical protein AB669_05365 [Pedobacter sp. BMA]